MALHRSPEINRFQGDCARAVTRLNKDLTFLMFNLVRDVIKTNILRKIGPKMWLLECKQDFLKI